MNVMKAQDLAKLWSRPDNTRLTKKQVSVRLPTHVAARLMALEQLYPMRTRTELVGDLLSAALKDVEQGLPSHRGRPVDEDPETRTVYYEELGDVARFRALANEAYKALEAELGNESAPRLFNADAYVIAEGDDR